jgi:hypothetical protein
MEGVEGFDPAADNLGDNDSRGTEEALRKSLSS